VCRGSHSTAAKTEEEQLLVESTQLPVEAAQRTMPSQELEPKLQGSECMAESPVLSIGFASAEDHSTQRTAQWIAADQLPVPSTRDLSR
jgi:hypothetical protein